jgi:hypothetical protein
MKYIINERDEKDKPKVKGDRFKKVRDGALLVFSICLATLFLLFLNNGSKQNNEAQNDEIISAFKETALYDFLDLEMVENAKNSGEVSDFEGEE